MLRLIVIGMLLMAGFSAGYIFGPGTPPLFSEAKQVQTLSETVVSPNLAGVGQAIIPDHYGRLVSVESVGRSTMLWFQADTGVIRRMQLSFWEGEVILDNNALFKHMEFDRVKSRSLTPLE